MVKTFSVSIEGGEEIHLSLSIDGNIIKNHSWQVVGGLKLLEAIEKLQKNFPSNISQIALPRENDPSTLLIKELLLRVRGEWIDGDDDPEVCHCRKISQKNIERAIILGAHTIESVRKRTSANTGCGACLPDVMDLIAKRIG